MWDMLRGIDRWLTLRRQSRRMRRRWRDIKFFLILILLCVLFNLCSLMCGLTGYTLQRLGLLPTATPTPISGSVSEIEIMHGPLKHASTNPDLFRWALSLQECPHAYQSQF